MRTRLLERFGSVLAVGLALAVASPIRAGETNAREVAIDGGWSLTRIDLELVIDPDEETLLVTGRGNLRFDGDAPSAGPTLAVNARESVMGFVSLNGPPGSKASFDGLHHPSYGASQLAVIELARPASAGDEFTFDFEVESSGRSSQFLVSRDLAVASWTEAWYPAPLAPAGTLSLSKISSAPGKMSIRMPPGWRSAAEGRVIEFEQDIDGATEVWESELPIARSFAAGPFNVATHRSGDPSGKRSGARDVSMYLLSQRSTGAETEARQLAEAIAAMERYFGRFPFPSYGVVEVPNGLFEWSAASQQGFLMAETQIFDAPDGNLPLFAHEAAHAWWGNKVGTVGPGSQLGSESLAQYGAVLAIEALEGAEAATEFLRFSRDGYNPLQCAKGYFQMAAAGHDAPLAQLEGGHWHHNLADAKGHWYFHMVRGRLGDERFFSTLRSLLRDFSGRKMSLTDIRSAFEMAATDDLEFERFQSQWLDRTGAPRLAARWSVIEESSSPVVALTITQEQDGEPYLLDLEVEVTGNAGSTLRLLQVRERETNVRLELTERPVQISLDPRHKLLIWTPEYAVEHPEGEGGGSTQPSPDGEVYRHPTSCPMDCGDWHERESRKRRTCPQCGMAFEPKAEIARPGASGLQSDSPPAVIAFSRPSPPS